MNRGNFYPFPTSAPAFDSVRPRELVPLREPPAPLLLYPPILPAEAQSRNTSSTQNAISKDFALSNHVFPAAYPRTTPFVPLPSAQLVDAIHSDSSTLTREERKGAVKKITEEILSLKARQVNGDQEFLPDEREDRLLWSCVTRYYRRSGFREKSRSITLLLLHANGFPKETWEPFLRHLIVSLENSHDRSVSVDEIWSLEATQHGDAALINRDKLGAVYDWQDHSRDILNFVTRYLPSRNDAFRTDLPVHLPRVSTQIENARLKDGFAGERTLVGIGHSLGGATVTLAAITHPALFSSLILVDPVIVPPYVNRGPNVGVLATGAIQRRHTWTNREEARELLATSPFFAAWDSEVLDNYVQFGLTTVDDRDGAVKLKMPGVQEAAVFAETRTSFEIFERLKGLDPSVALHWVMAGKGSWITGSEAATRDLVWRRPANSSNTQLASEHLIVQQAPKDLAFEVHAFLERRYSTNGQSQTQARL